MSLAVSAVMCISYSKKSASHRLSTLDLPLGNENAVEI